MNFTIKEMKLIFARNGDTWDKVITDLAGNVIFEQRGIVLFPEQINKEYFDDWENQMRGIPAFNIVQVERFV